MTSLVLVLYQGGTLLVQCCDDSHDIIEIVSDEDGAEADHHIEDCVSCSYIWSIFFLYFSRTKCRLTFMVGVNSPVARLKSWGAIMNLWTWETKNNFCYERGFIISLYLCSIWNCSLVDLLDTIHNLRFDLGIVFCNKLLNCFSFNSKTFSPLKYILFNDKTKMKPWENKYTFVD